MRWLFFDASRWTVALLILAGVFALFLTLGRAGVLDFRNDNTVLLMLSVFVGGHFTVISIVVTINQLVVSRAFGKPHTLRERNEGIKRFRRDIGSALGVEPGSADPIRFFRELVRAIGDRANESERRSRRRPTAN